MKREYVNMKIAMLQQWKTLLYFSSFQITLNVFLLLLFMKITVIEGNMWWIDKLVGNLEQERYGKKMGITWGEEMKFAIWERRSSVHAVSPVMNFTCGIRHLSSYFGMHLFLWFSKFPNNYICRLCVWWENTMFEIALLRYNWYKEREGPILQIHLWPSSDW